MTESDTAAYATAANRRSNRVEPSPGVLDLRCQCERTDHPQFPDGRCHRDGDGAEQMTGGKVVASPALCLPCLFACADDDDDYEGEF